MSIPLALVAVLLGSSAPVPKTCLPDPPGASTPSGAAAHIGEAETDWAASVARGGEAAFLRRFAADDFVAIFEGKVLSRAALIAEAEERRPGMAADKLETLRVHLFGATAVAEGSEIWSESASGVRTRLVWSDLWVRCGGEWRLRTSTSIGSPAN